MGNNADMLTSSSSSSLARRVWSPCIACALLCVVAWRGCRTTPQMQHYQMSLEAERDRITRVDASGEALTLGVDDFTAEASYDDVRMIYRKSPYRVDYYHYHRWSAPPSMMVTDVLRQGFEQTGAFKQVTTGYGRGVDAVLRGRLVAIEEVDESEESWKARMTLDLELEDGRTGEVLWSSVLTRTRDVETRNPEGVAIALSQVLGDMVVELTPILTTSYHSAKETPSVTRSTPSQDAF